MIHSDNVKAAVMTHRNGFQIKLPNGYRVSFSFGQGSYADNRYAGMGTTPAPDQWEASNFELGVFDLEDEMMDLVKEYDSDGTVRTDQVIGWVPAHLLRDILTRVAFWSKDDTEKNKERALALGKFCEKSRTEFEHLEVKYSENR